MKTVPSGKLSDEIQKILVRYADEIADGTDEAAKKAAQQCVKDIKSGAESKFGGTGRYARSWTKKQTDRPRGKSGYIVYSRIPGLPHLLENGHAKVRGGRVEGRPHIAPAAEKAAEDFENAVKELVRNG